MNMCNFFSQERKRKKKHLRTMVFLIVQLRILKKSTQNKITSTIPSLTRNFPDFKYQKSTIAKIEDDLHPSLLAASHTFLTKTPWHSWAEYLNFFLKFYPAISSAFENILFSGSLASSTPKGRRKTAHSCNFPHEMRTCLVIASDTGKHGRHV